MINFSLCCHITNRQTNSDIAIKIYQFENNKKKQDFIP